MSGHEREPVEEPGLWPFEVYADHYRLAYDAAMDAVRDQRERLEVVRSRAATVLSAAALVTAFVGERIFDDGALDRLDTGWWILTSDVAMVAAVLSFAWIAVGTLLTWLPARGRYALSGQRIVDGYVEQTGERPWTMPELHRDLALWTSEYVDENEPAIRWRLRVLAWSCGALGFELVMLLLVLWDLTP